MVGVRITLDAETFRALASTTRLAVLRALDERRKTLSELSRDLALNKATVHEHLALLSAAELVKKRDDEGRKWIYYELTWRGQKILHPQETTTFNVLLGLSILAAGGGGAMLARALIAAGEQAQNKVADLEASDFRDTEGASAPMNQDTASSGDPSAASSSPAASPAAGQSAPPANETGSGGIGGSVGGDLADNDTAPPLLDEAGWLAVAVIASSLLFGLLAGLLRMRLRPKRAEAPGLE